MNENVEVQKIKTKAGKIQKGVNPKNTGRETERAQELDTKNTNELTQTQRNTGTK